MKRVLIISPHFPPVNAADMHRVRQLLPYLAEYGWEAEVVAVDPRFIEAYSEDPLLLETVPASVPVHLVSALPVEMTRRYGLGSLSIRSWIAYRRKGNALLATGRFDLVFFSTTAFHVMALGPYWKRKFGIPFVLDIQDPWRNDFYLSRPKAERPPKFWISHRLDSFLEARTVPTADAIISVSKGYCEVFARRYPGFRSSLSHVIPFGAFDRDMAIVDKFAAKFARRFSPDRVNIVYIGRGGHDMHYALELFFAAVRLGLDNEPALFERIHCWFMGTSYAMKGRGQQTIAPIAASFGLENRVTESTDRLPYFDTLFQLRQADLLFVPGSTDTQYTASKIFPYILAQKPMLALFHTDSSVHRILQDAGTDESIRFTASPAEKQVLITGIYERLHRFLKDRAAAPPLNHARFEPHTARYMTKRILGVFQDIVTTNESAVR